MDISSILNGISIGKETTGNLKPTLEGLAVRTTAGGKFYMWHKGRLLDVSDLTLDGGENYVVRIPVRKEDIGEGDIVITSEDPFGALFVQSVESDGTLKGVNPGTRERVEYVPPTNVFLNGVLYVKAISLIGGLQDGTGTDSLLPLLLLSNKTGTGTPTDTMTALLMSNALGGGAVNETQLLPALLLAGGASGSLENLLLMQTLSRTKHLSRLFEKKPDGKKTAKSDD